LRKQVPEGLYLRAVGVLNRGTPSVHAAEGTGRPLCETVHAFDLRFDVSLAVGSASRIAALVDCPACRHRLAEDYDV
jgi:hypothetical protein